MMKKLNANLHISTAYGASLILVLPILVVLLGMSFDSRMDFNPSTFYLLIPSFIYFLYAHFIVRNYYEGKVNKRIASLQKITIRVDEMISREVECSNFNYLGLGANVNEYFFTIYNKKYDKYFRISSVNDRPSYADMYIPEWEGEEMTIYVDIEDLKGSKSTVRIFRFILGVYNLEDKYAYSISEDIAKKGFFESILLVYPFLFLCMYVLIVGIEF